MKVNEFISELRAAPQNRLLFANNAGDLVHAGYHLTQLKTATLAAVDCGGQVNH